MILIKRLFAQQFFFPIDFDLSDYLLWTDRKKNAKEMNLIYNSKLTFSPWTWNSSSVPTLAGCKHVKAKDFKYFLKISEKFSTKCNQLKAFPLQGEWHRRWKRDNCGKSQHRIPANKSLSSVTCRVSRPKRDVKEHCQIFVRYVFFSLAAAVSLRALRRS